MADRRPTNDRTCPIYGTPIDHAKSRYGCECTDSECYMNLPEDQVEEVKRGEAATGDYSAILDAGGGE